MNVDSGYNLEILSEQQVCAEEVVDLLVELFVHLNKLRQWLLKLAMYIHFVFTQSPNLQVFCTRGIFVRHVWARSMY